MDDPAEERDVAAGADRHVQVGDTRSCGVKRGSTWMSFAPRSLASITHWKPTGWHSAMFEPMITMQSEFCRSCWKSWRRRDRTRSPDRGPWSECHMRAWFSIWTAPSAVNSFLMR